MAAIAEVNCNLLTRNVINFAEFKSQHPIQSEGLSSFWNV